MHRKNTKKGERFRVSSSSGFVDDYQYSELKRLYFEIKEKYEVTAADIMSKLEEKEILVPCSVFNEKLSAFESIVKYLKENLSLPNREIANLIFKSQKSIWQVYNSSKKKLPAVFRVIDSPYNIPVSALHKPLTILESVVKYLKENRELTLHEIAIVLHRDDRTIWTVYDRVIRKQKISGVANRFATKKKVKNGR